MAAQGIRDPKYYFEDGSVTFLVEGYLFKIPGSLIISKSEVFRDMFKLPKQLGIGSSSLSSGAEGSCDENPIVIPQVQAKQFRHLMLFFYGIMTDHDYASLVSGFAYEPHRDATSFELYLNIASLANRFCMPEVETWAQKQFAQVLRYLHRLPSLAWDHKILEALKYSKLTPDRDLEHTVRNLAECVLQIPDSSTADTWQSRSVAQCYKDPTLKKEDPALFGHIFCVVLSAGHQSSFWKTHLTRYDRSILFAAQVCLTPLPATLSIDWIGDVSKVSAMVDARKRPSCFNSCLVPFTKGFNCLFILRDQLSSDSPLVGITAVSSLVWRRATLAESFKSTYSSCKCTSLLLSALDLKMDTLFAEIAEKYHDCLD